MIRKMMVKPSKSCHKIEAHIHEILSLPPKKTIDGTKVVKSVPTIHNPSATLAI